MHVAIPALDRLSAAPQPGSAGYGGPDDMPFESEFVTSDHQPLALIVLVGVTATDATSLACDLAREGYDVFADAGSGSSPAGVELQGIRALVKNRLALGQAVTALTLAPRHASRQSVSQVLTFGELTIDRNRYEVRIKERRAAFSKSEFNVLFHLASHPGLVLTREQIVAAIQGADYLASDRSVDVHIANIRRKLGDLAGLIQTTRGIGYRFEAENSKTGG
jgi:DNA-binding winged helix-turn-helix (wHTH) protein